MDFPFNRDLDRQSADTMIQMIKSGLNTPLTSSMGRLFDGVAAIVALRNRAFYEGQAAMELEMAVRGGVTDAGCYPFEWKTAEGCRRISTAAIIRGVVEDLASGRSVGEISARFHHTLLVLFSDICEDVRRERGLNRVALSGGSFQNAILLRGMVALSP